MSPMHVAGCPLPYFSCIPPEFQFCGGKQLQASVVTWLQGWLLLDPDCCVTPVTDNKLL